MAMFGEASDASDEGQYQWEWDPAAPNRVTANKNGTTGWGIILRSTNANHKAGSLLRIHICTHQPCLARYPPSKYGLLPQPVHMREVPNPFDESAVLEQSVLATAVAEPTCELITAVAEPPGDLPPPAASPELEPASDASAVVPATAVAEPTSELPPTTTPSSASRGRTSTSNGGT